MLEKLKQIAELVAKNQSQLKNTVQAIREQQQNFDFSSEDSLILPVSKTSINTNICGIDSGFVSDRVHGIDLLITKTVAANFIYENSKIKRFQHLPDRFPDIELEARSGDDEHSTLLWRSLVRLSKEVLSAISAIKEFSPTFLLLDGSILPLPSDRPSESSPFFSTYQELISNYKKLYTICDEKNCQLVGVIKDSRSRRLVTCFDDKIAASDSLFVDYLLHAGERTCSFQYSDKKQPILKDLAQYSDRFYACYIKPSNNDIPLRIEYLKSNNSADKIASVLHTLSSSSESFAYPAVLIEADLCAVLNPIEIENVKQSLFHLSKGDIKPLRRHSRPFR